MNKLGALPLLVALLPLGIIGCGSDDDEPEVKSGRVEIFSFWLNPGEKEALQALLDVHKEEYPKVEVVNTAAEDAANARTTLAQRLKDGLPPDTFQANIGSDLFSWVEFAGGDDQQSKVQSLNKLADQFGWREDFPTPVLDALSYEASGQLYAIPMNIHRINSLFYDMRFFEANGLTPPETLDDLAAVCAAVKTIDPNKACLSIGNKNNWTMNLFTFEVLLPSMLGPEFYENYFFGRMQANAPEINDVLDRVLALYKNDFNKDILTIDWPEGVDHLANSIAASKAGTPPTGETAAMTVMGDWAKGYLEAEHDLDPGVDFQQIAFPGANGTFVFTADSFPLAKGAPNRTLAVDLLQTFASEEGQVAFNRVKGSIPARKELSQAGRDQFDATAQKTMDDFKAANEEEKLVRALSGVLPSDFPDLAKAVREMLEADDKTPVLQTLEAGYPTLTD